LVFEHSLAGWKFFMEGKPCKKRFKGKFCIDLDTDIYLAQSLKPNPHLLNEDLKNCTGPPGSNSLTILLTSVPDPWYYGTDPVPRICTTEIRIRILLQIRLVSSVTFTMPTKKNIFS
jgi:hypothetical protein